MAEWRKGRDCTRDVAGMEGRMRSREGGHALGVVWSDVSVDTRSGYEKDGGRKGKGRKREKSNQVPIGKKAELRHIGIMRRESVQLDLQI